MVSPVIHYDRNTASREEICSHLWRSNDNFIPPLDQRVNIEEYGQKIFDNAMTFEAWHDRTLVGLVAAYVNDPSGSSSAYITSVSTEKAYMRQGIAGNLINACLEYAKECGIRKISLEVHRENISALRLYTRYGFEKTDTPERESLLMAVSL